MPKATVEIDTERYAKSVVFFISCTAARGGLTPSAVYVARDAKGTGAKLVTFESLAPDGSASKLEMLYSVTPAREAFTKEGDQQPHAHVQRRNALAGRRLGARRPAGRLRDLRDMAAAG